MLIIWGCEIWIGGVYCEKISYTMFRTNNEMLRRSETKLALLVSSIKIVIFFCSSSNKTTIYPILDTYPIVSHKVFFFVKRIKFTFHTF